MVKNPPIHQQQAYDQAYSDAAVIPFPDHKVEGDAMLTGKTIVSIGGGTGNDVAHLAKNNQVWVLDYSSAAAKAAEHFGIQHRTLDLNQAGFRLPFEDRSVDVLVLKDILEHLLSPEALIAESRRVLKSDGYMVISLPNHFNLWGRIRVLFGKNLIWRGILHDHRDSYDEWNYMHIRFFTWPGVKRLLTASNLKLKRTFFDFGPLGHYFSPSMLCEHLEIKREKGSLTSKGRVFLTVMKPLSVVLGLFFPARLRDLICKISPSLLTSCFYLHVTKVDRP